MKKDLPLFHTCLSKNTVLFMLLVQVITSSIKVTSEKPFSATIALFLDTANSRWGLSGQPFCISNTWWSFNVHIDSLSGTVEAAACDAAHEFTVMMNGCLVCWFYGVFSGSCRRGRQPRWVGRQPKGAHRGDIQLPVVTHSASHPVHLRTPGSHKEPLARRTRSF